MSKMSSNAVNLLDNYNIIIINGLLEAIGPLSICLAFDISTLSFFSFLHTKFIMVRNVSNLLDLSRQSRHEENKLCNKI
jgi:hypothetical protein